MGAGILVLSTKKCTLYLGRYVTSNNEILSETSNEAS